MLGNRSKHLNARLNTETIKCTSLNEYGLKRNVQYPDFCDHVASNLPKHNYINSDEPLTSDRCSDSNLNPTRDSKFSSVKNSIKFIYAD